MSCWLRHSYLTDDSHTKMVNSINLCLIAVSLGAYAYYQPVRKYLYGQLAAVSLVLFLIFSYVGSIPDEVKAADIMGKIAAMAQNGGLFAGIYEIKRIFTLKTTEFVPAHFQFAMFLIISQWTLFAFLSGNFYLVFANLPGLILNVFTISLYFFYPPITWQVPFIGRQKADDKSE